MEGLEAFYTTIAGSFSCPQDAVVSFIHWAITKNGYKCVGSGDEPGSADRRSELLPAGWNSNKEVYTLRYHGRVGTGRYLLKALVDSDVVIVTLMNSDTERDSTLSVNVGDHADAARLQSFDHAYKDAAGLAEKVRAQLLAPQEGPAAKATTETGTMTEGRPYEEDDYRDHRDYRGSGYYPQPRGEWHPVPPQWPPRVGGADLDPLNPLGGGSLMDPRHMMPPRFNPHAGIPGGGNLPPGAVPPGARFDPFGPEPEPDHLAPPGFEDQYSRPMRHRPRPGPPGGPGFSPNTFGTPGGFQFGTPGGTGSTLFGTPGGTGSTLFGTPGGTGSTLFGTPGGTGSTLFGTPGGTGSTPNAFGTPGGTGSTPNAFGTPGGTGSTPNAFGTPGGTGSTPNAFGTPGGTGSTPNAFGTPGGFQFGTPGGTGSTPNAFGTPGGFRFS